MRAGSVSGKTFPVDPLAGMTREQAREFTQRMREAAFGSPYVTVLAMDMVRLLALAARGAECVGAEEMWCDKRTGLLYVNQQPGFRRVLVLKEDK